jgi:hypothetical protein
VSIKTLSSKLKVTPSIEMAANVPAFVNVAPTPAVPLLYVAFKFDGDSTLTYV